MTQISNIIIADDHPIFRKGLREIIEKNAEYNVIAEAESGKTALQYYQHYQPDIMILDISMGDMNGLDVAETILTSNKQALCVMMTMYSDSSFCKRALSLGVKGYLIKDDAVDTIITCLHKVRYHERYISESLGDIDNFLNTQTQITAESVLSKKEMTILMAISQLKTNKEIAQQENISLRTVQNHRQNMSNKLNLSGRQALLQFAIQWAKTSI